MKRKLLTKMVLATLALLPQTMLADVTLNDLRATDTEDTYIRCNFKNDEGTALHESWTITYTGSGWGVGDTYGLWFWNCNPADITCTRELPAGTYIMATNIQKINGGRCTFTASSGDSTLGTSYRDNGFSGTFYVPFYVASDGDVTFAYNWLWGSKASLEIVDATLYSVKAGTETGDYTSLLTDVTAELIAAMMAGDEGEDPYADAEGPLWITANSIAANVAGTWVAFRKDITLETVPATAALKIAADSKYWLWVNGEMVVFEGGLKRGPTPDDTYYDVVDVAPYLQTGKNRVAVLLCYFGKNGYSHNSSGRSGLIVDGSESIGLVSDASWQSLRLEAYGTSSSATPNWRLAESNICYDARKAIGDWQTDDDVVAASFAASKAVGTWGSAPWNALVERPVPQWKNFGLTTVTDYTTATGGGTTTLTIRLPYNMQLTPYIDITDTEGGTTVSLSTDHKYVSGECISAEYITRAGTQQYESLGWMNGDVLYVSYPSTASVTVNAVGYRETGYDAEFTGSFTSGDDFINRFWTKALRTLYVNMRDTYFDCPDRERAQWWGDVTVLMSQSFYQMDSRAWQLMRKAIRELVNWQRADNTLYSPIPEGNYHETDGELPAQMLAAMSTYGFWNYYRHTGDTETMAYAYPAMKRYLSIWELEENGLTKYRTGDWDWVDWGSNADKNLIMAAWHYMALESAVNVATLIGETTDIEGYQAQMQRIKTAFETYWNGEAYTYSGTVDDRAQAVAVVSGIAPAEHYDALATAILAHENASPYMEKYVLEALFRMGRGTDAISRMKRRYATMVNATDHSTLYEYWTAGGSTNHAWSGGPLTVIAQQLFGIATEGTAFTTFSVAPQTAGLTEAAISVPTLHGNIAMSFNVSATRHEYTIIVPEGTTATFVIPTNAEFESFTLDGTTVAPGTTTLALAAGSHTVVGQLVMKTALGEAIDAATTTSDAKEGAQGTAPFQYPAEAYEALTTAIAAAQAVYDDDAATQAQCEVQVVALNQAVETFLGSMNLPDADTYYYLTQTVEGQTWYLNLWEREGDRFPGADDVWTSSYPSVLSTLPCVVKLEMVDGSTTQCRIRNAAGKYLTTFTNWENQLTASATVSGQYNTWNVIPRADGTVSFGSQRRDGYVLAPWAIVNGQTVGCSDDRYPAWTVSEAAPTEVPLIVPSAQWGTFVAPFEVELPSGVSAYTTAVNSDGVNLDLTELVSVPANTPVLLHASTPVSLAMQGFASFPYAGQVTVEALTGIYTAASLPEDSYILQRQGQDIGFYSIGSATVPGTPFCAYLTASADTQVKGYVLTGSPGTGLNELEQNSCELIHGSSVAYSLSGQRISMPAMPRKGVYIVGGKKIAVK